ncbi:chloride channel protein 7 [Stylonychia lemnae]|uniref:Chloride channel protein n=1 Tax=Stylonychia lemnae TaxID=5949 RepID=A0A078A5W1_STYLE|nr:chloride channel protein 7 [Stylonychia lemnae]|eukprot:CDW77635.1 chloride channel protein 7 [Stylonychia lemnae]
MRPDKSFRIYPRPDQDYKKKDSLDIQKVTGKLYGKRPTGNKVQAYLWILCFIIGVVMGSIAFIMDIIVVELVDLKWQSTQDIARTNVGLGWFVLILYSLCFVFIAAVISVYIAPAAIGSGVAEAMGLLNGIAQQDYICLKTLVVKTLGVSLAVAGGLCGGKEGPLVHIGSIVGYASAYIPMKFTRYFRNDFEKRKLMAVGTAAGVSAAFGAPIGGSLFAYEISKPSTFWSFSLTWKTFFASTISTFVLSVFKQLYDGKFPIYVSSSDIVKLGASQKPVTLDSLFAAVIIGISGGFLGACFIRINNQINKYRKQYLKEKWMKVAEALCLTLVTMTTFYIAMYIKYASDDDPNNDTEICQKLKPEVPSREFLCPEGTFDRLATILFDTQSNTIKTFMSDRREILWQNALIFGIIWYIFLCLTSGVAAPLGIFIPCILIGCSLGHLYFKIHYMIFSASDSELIRPSTFAILGSTAVLAGSTRMTYSLAVIMLETTSSVDIFLPIIFTLFVSYGSGTLLINKSIYRSALRSKNIPLLLKDIPKENGHYQAQQLMSSPVRAFNFIVKVQDVLFQLSTTTINGFPVLNCHRRVIGIIERDTLIVLIKNKAWYSVKGEVEEVKEADVQTNAKNKTSTERYVSTQSINRLDEEQLIDMVSDNTITNQEQLLHKDMWDNLTRREYLDDKDYVKYPLQEDKLQWEDLNQNFKSLIRDYKDILDIAKANLERELDLRPYMIDRPFTVCSQDKFSKVLKIFIQMQLRQLPVVSESNGQILGIITRQDLFQYMTL